MNNIVKKFRVNCNMSVDFTKSLYVYGTDEEDVKKKVKESFNGEEFYIHYDDIGLDIPTFCFKDKNRTKVFEKCDEKGQYEGVDIPIFRIDEDCRSVDLIIEETDEQMVLDFEEGWEIESDGTINYCDYKYEG